MEDLHVCLVLILIALLMYHSNNKCGFRSKGVKIYRFYRPGCIHCRNMHAEWVKFIRQSNGVEIIDVNMDNVSDEHKRLYEKSNGQSIPHVIKLKNNNISVYRGPRLSDNFMKFALE